MANDTADAWCPSCPPPCSPAPMPAPARRWSAGRAMRSTQILTRAIPAKTACAWSQQTAPRNSIPR
eukprot:1018137-Lingulodinium_polyedra.AAC.1